MSSEFCKDQQHFDPAIATRLGITASILHWELKTALQNAFTHVEYSDDRGIPWISTTLENICKAIPYLKLNDVREAMKILQAAREIEIKCSAGKIWYTCFVD